MVQQCKGRNSLLYLSLLVSFSSVAVPVSPQTLVVQAKPANSDTTQQQATPGSPWYAGPCGTEQHD